MLSALAAAVGGTLPHTARMPTPSVPSAQGTTKRSTAGAQSRGARWGRAAHPPMGRSSASTVEDLMGRGRMPVLSRGSPGERSRGGDRHPQNCGRRARGPRDPKSGPRPPAQGEEKGEAEGPVPEEEGAAQAAMEVEE